MDAGTRVRTDWIPYLVGSVGVIFVVLFLIYPVGKVALLAFVPRGVELSFEALGLANFLALLRSSLFRTAFAHTLVVALCSTALAVLIAVPAAYAVARIRLPGRGVLLTLAVIPLISPPFIGAYSWVVLLGNRGLVTRHVMMLTGFQLPPIYGQLGITLALVLSFFPYILLFVQAALSSADPSLEESARVMGASRLRILLTVTLPMIVPSAAAGALLVFVQSLGNFGVPSILGRNYMMLTTMIVYEIQGTFDVNAAAAIALVSMALTTVALLLMSRFTRRQRFITVTSTSRAALRGGTTGLRVLAGGYVWGLLLLATAPQIVVVFNSFVTAWPGTLWPTRYGLDNYRYVLRNFFEPMLNSVALSAMATAVCVVIGTLTAYASLRKGFRGRALLDVSVMLPFVMPGLITGIAFLVAFNSGWLILSGSAAIVVLAYVAHRLAYIFRAVSAAINQVDTRIEEASVVCGAPWGMTMRRVVLPLVTPGILAGAILVFATLIMDLSITLLLYPAQWKTLAIVMFEQLSNDRFGYASASGTIVVLVTTLLVFGASRLVNRSMSALFQTS